MPSSSPRSQLDSHDDLLRTELALCAQADALVHVTQADCDFFAIRLPDKHHEVVLPTLDPGSEAELIRLRSASCPAGAGSFLYVGTQHEANLATVRWLLTGRKVLYQPKALVVHHEGTSNGTDMRSGIKTYLVENQAKFRERWRSELEESHMPKPH